MTAERLEQWLNASQQDTEAWLLDGLKIGCDLLNLETGIVSQIKGPDYIIQQTFSRLGDIFKPGDRFELQNTYCEAVTRRKKTITYIQVGSIPEMRLHPVYVAVQLESYIGSPLLDEQGNVIGTINFSSHAARPAYFSEEEIDIVERMAKAIQQRLMREFAA